MAIYEFEGKVPKIGEGCYVFDEAVIIGDVELGPGCYVGAGAVIRGDYGTIRIGENTAIEDNCTIHARPGDICTIGKNVTLGHGAIVHNATIGDWVVIGMGATVSDYSTVGEWAAVGEGAVVKNKSEIPEGAIAVGIPAKVVSQTSEEYREQWVKFKAIYVELASKRYPAGLKKIG
ncbi:MAG: gamma carbonic anhydrase family protein [Thermoplasmata archaeon]|nr:gamma carbonic anhydrase family protein [Thermoplasmata archaeon]